MVDPAVTSEMPAEQETLPPATYEAGAESGRPDQAWRDLANLILQAEGEYVVAFEEAEAEDFRERIREAAGTLSGAPKTAQVLITAGAVSQAISFHNQRTLQKLERLKDTLQGIVEPLVDHIAALQKDAGAAGSLEQFRSAVLGHVHEGAYEKLSEALPTLLEPLEEASREARTEAQQLQEKLLDQITMLEQSQVSETVSRPAKSSSAAATDACTGLPVRAEAELAITQALESGRQMYLAVFYLHRMGLTNARFGETIGDQVILFCSQHIATTITEPQDQLFRWSGPAFVVLLERSESLLTVSGEVQRALSTPLSRFFETATRSVYLPIKLTGEVYPLENATLPEVENHIQNYLLKASGVETESL